MSIHKCYRPLTLLGTMEFSIHLPTVKSGWSMVYIEGSQVIISKKYCISSEDRFSLLVCLFV